MKKRKLSLLFSSARAAAGSVWWTAKHINHTHARFPRRHDDRPTTGHASPSVLLNVNLWRDGWLPLQHNEPIQRSSNGASFADRTSTGSINTAVQYAIPLII